MEADTNAPKLATKLNTGGSAKAAGKLTPDSTKDVVANRGRHFPEKQSATAKAAPTTAGRFAKSNRWQARLPLAKGKMVVFGSAIRLRKAPIL